MKLITKLSLFSLMLVLMTALTTTLFSISTIRGIIYDLNSQLVRKDLTSLQSAITEEYRALEKHGLANVNAYYQKVILRIKDEIENNYKNEMNNLIILDKNGDEILSSGADKQYLQKGVTKTIYLDSGKTQQIKILDKGEYVYFYKIIPEWKLGLFIIVKNQVLYSRLNDYIDTTIAGLIIIIFLALFAGFLFSSYLVTQIHEVLRQISAIKNGNLDARINNIKGHDEISELKSGLNKMTEFIAEKMHQQSQAELRARQSQKKQDDHHALLDAFIHAMPDRAFILDEHGRYIEVFGGDELLLNSSKEQLLLNSSKEQLLGNYVMDILPAPIGDEVMQTIAQTIKTGTRQTLEYTLEKDGRETSFLGQCVVFNFNNNNTSDQKMIVWLAHDITELVEAKKKTHELSLYDPLTHLPNRRLLMERLEEEIARAERHDLFGALLFIDLDDFKTVNDTSGHRVGDLLLQESARRLNNLLRKEDLACRLGGDEFVILLSDLENNVLTASSQAQIIAGKILNSLKNPYELEGRSHQISCSIGIVLFPEESRDNHDLVKYADIAMYQAKNSGKNTIKLFSSYMQNILEHRLYLQNELRMALQQQGLTVYLQPQYNEHYQIISAEALVRWEHPEHGFISPAEFIPVAEESGLIHALGKEVLSMVLVTLHEILKGGTPETFKRIAVNVSPCQFGRGDFVAEVKELLEKYQVPAQFLEIEITEQTLIGNFSIFAEKMKQLQEMGIHFSVDDFGTGYSSLSYLKSLPVNMLKIDRTFIRDINIDKNDDAIVITIIMMARNLGLEVIAEGVETRQQLDFLVENGCHLYQGYYFSKPVPVTTFMNKLADNSINRFKKNGDVRDC